MAHCTYPNDNDADPLKFSFLFAITWKMNNSKSKTLQTMCDWEKNHLWLGLLVICFVLVSVWFRIERFRWRGKMCLCFFSFHLQFFYSKLMNHSIVKRATADGTIELEEHFRSRLRLRRYLYTHTELFNSRLLFLFTDLSHDIAFGQTCTLLTSSLDYSTISKILSTSFLTMMRILFSRIFVAFYKYWKMKMRISIIAFRSECRQNLCWG